MSFQGEYGGSPARRVRAMCSTQARTVNTPLKSKLPGMRSGYTKP